MKRSKPLKRKTPLRAKKPLKRNPMARRPKPTGPKPDVVDAVYDRAMHGCERCGRIVGPRRGIDHHLHHRRPRAMGGTDRPETNWPSNVVLLDPGCHEWIENHRAEAEADGWLVPQAGDPARFPVLIAGRGWRYLTNDGHYAVYPAPKRGDDGA